MRDSVETKLVEHRGGTASLDWEGVRLQTVLPAEASLEEVDRLNHRVEDLLRQVAEVEDVVRRTTG